MKKEKILRKIIIIFMVCILPTTQVYAGSGTVYVHWLDDIRWQTYNDTDNYAYQMGYYVVSCENWDNTDILNQLASAKIIVCHTHGKHGRQQFQDTYLSGKHGNGEDVKAVDSLPNGSLNQLKIAIFYGCNTGNTNSVYGNLPQEVVNTGAQAAVAWKIQTKVNEVNEWNKYFFSKARNDTIVESYIHADYWTRERLGEDAGNNMQFNRTEAGNIYGTIY